MLLSRILCSFWTLFHHFQHFSPLPFINIFKIWNPYSYVTFGWGALSRGSPWNFFHTPRRSASESDFFYIEAEFVSDSHINFTKVVVCLLHLASLAMSWNFHTIRTCTFTTYILLPTLLLCLELSMLMLWTEWRTNHFFQFVSAFYFSSLMCFSFSYYSRWR